MYDYEIDLSKWLWFSYKLTLWEFSTRNYKTPLTPLTSLKYLLSFPGGLLWNKSSLILSVLIYLKVHLLLSFSFRNIPRMLGSAAGCLQL